LTASLFLFQVASVNLLIYLSHLIPIHLTGEGVMLTSMFFLEIKKEKLGREACPDLSSNPSTAKKTVSFENILKFSLPSF
jgi:hypothetical protein